MPTRNVRTRFLGALAGALIATQLGLFDTSDRRAAATPVAPPGGPVLVITDPSRPFTRYYGEILGAEGLNDYSMTNLAQVSAATLAGHDVVVLGEMPADRSAGHDADHLGHQRRQPHRHAPRQEARAAARPHLDHRDARRTAI